MNDLITPAFSPLHDLFRFLHNKIRDSVLATVGSKMSDFSHMLLIQLNEAPSKEDSRRIKSRITSHLQSCLVENRKDVMDTYRETSVSFKLEHVHNVGYTSPNIFQLNIFNFNLCLYLSNDLTTLEK